MSTLKWVPMNRDELKAPCGIDPVSTARGPSGREHAARLQQSRMTVVDGVRQLALGILECLPSFCAVAELLLRPAERQPGKPGAVGKRQIALQGHRGFECEPRILLRGQCVSDTQLGF